VIYLPDTGYIQVSAFTSNARFPLKDVAVTVTATDGTVLAMRLTDNSGRIQPIPIPVPDRLDSLTPDPPEIPFARVNLYARSPGYVQIENEDLQVFADTVTDQNLAMIPLSELPDSWGEKELFQTPVQNL
jgi:hypothetical protein